MTEHPPVHPASAPWRRRLTRAARSGGVRAGFFGLLALVATWIPLGQAGGLNAFRDAHLLHSYEEAAVRTLVEYRQLPLWNPWACGGLDAVGSPQTRLASPGLLLSATLGAHRAAPVLLFLLLLVGMEGAYRYARLRARSALGALLAAPLFGLGGFFALAWTIGWLNFLGFALMPWALLGVNALVRLRPAGLLLVPGSFALMFGFGGTYPVPLTALFVGLEALLLLGARRLRGRRLRAALWLAAGALFTAGLCAFRLWPVLDTLHAASRVMGGRPGHGLPQVLGMLGHFPLPPDRAGPSLGITYFAPIALVFAAFGLWRRRPFIPLVGLIAAGWLALGYAATPSLFALLRTLPVFSTFRYPERMLVPAGLFLAVLVASGVGVVLRMTRGLRLGSQALVGTIVLGLLGIALQEAAFLTLLRRAEIGPLPTRVTQPFAQARGNRWVQGHVLALDRGSIACGEAYPVPMSPLLRGDLAQEEYLSDPSAGHVRRASWSPLELQLDVDATRPAQLRVNQNWHPGWTSDVGTVVNVEGLLAVDLPPGAHRVTLRFRPRGTLGGMAVSALALTTLGLAIALLRRRRGGDWLLLLPFVPLAAWGTLALTWTQPRAEPVLTNPDRSPPVAERVPEKARPIDARFELPLELVAAEIPAHPAEDGLVPMVFYWRVHGEVPRTLGVWVHVSGPAGSKRRSADHELIGGTWFFHDAPSDALVRDAFAVHLDGRHPGRWVVRAGLWHPRGDGTRVPVRDARGQLLPDAALVVGEVTVGPAEEAAPTLAAPP